MAEKFDKFTERARKVFTFAQEESQRLNHNSIGTEHLLLGLMREGSGLAAMVLTNLGVTLPKARDEIAAIIGLGQGEATGDPGLTPRAKRVIELSMDEARRLNHDHIGTEHLLLGLVREGEGVAVIALKKMGVDPEKVRQQIMPLMRSAPYPEPQRPPQQIGAPVEIPPIGGADEYMEKFTERARRVFVLAHEEAERFNHNYIGTEHILLGLVKEGDGIAARVLISLGVQLPKVRSAVEFIIGRGDGLIVGNPGLTPRSKKVLRLAMDEARRLNNEYIGTEHLLLGLVREGEGIAAGVLESLGVSLEKVRQSVMQVVSQSSTYQQTQQPQPMPPKTQPEPSEAMYTFTMRRDEFRKLAERAIEQKRSVDDMIGEAIRRVWLTDQDEPETSPTE